MEAQKEFPQEKELAEKVARLGELNALLDMDKKDHIVMEEEPEEEEIEPEREKICLGCGKNAYRGTDTVIHSLIYKCGKQQKRTIAGGQNFWYSWAGKEEKKAMKIEDVDIYDLPIWACAVVDEISETCKNRLKSSPEYSRILKESDELLFKYIYLYTD